MTPGGGEPSRHTVVVTTSYPTHPGDPSGHFVAAEVRALRERGVRVTVLAPRVRGSARAPAADVRWLPGGDGFGWPGALERVRARPLRALGAVHFVLAARRELARLHDADRVIAHFVVPSAWPIARPAAHRRLEVVAHGSDVRLVERLPAALRHAIARALAGADVRCVSSELAGRLERALGPAFEASIRVVPPALEIGPMRDRAACRRALGLDATARIAVVVGRLVAAKRVEVALRALSFVPGLTPVVVGDGPERERLERAFADARFVGRVERSVALDYIAAADVLVSASRDEGAPSAIREARALGTRVVSVPAGDLARWSEVDGGLAVVAGGV